MAASYWSRDMLLRLLQELVHHDPSATKELDEEITFQRAFGLPHAGEREPRSDLPLRVTRLLQLEGSAGVAQW